MRITNLEIIGYFYKNTGHEMDEAGDLVVLTVPFAAGVAAMSLLARAAFRSPVTAAVLSIVFLYSASVIAILTLRGSGPGKSRTVERLPYAALFFAAGAFCFCASSLWPDIDAVKPRMADAAYARLQTLIDRVPYKDDRTGALVKALLTGDRSGLPREVIRQFRASGASHILALSGLHLGIIYLIIRRLLGVAGNTGMAKIIRCVATIACTGFYTMMTGAGPSCVRAWLFITISELASIAPGRKKSAISVFWVSVTVQLAFDPGVIREIGFQLSYLAICGMITIYPWLQGFYPEADCAFAKFDPMRRIWNAAALAISCQVFTAPVAWNTFHTFPKYFLLTNLLALPLSTAIMGVSVLTIALSGIGWCPQFVVAADEACVQALLFVLEVISGM